MNDLLLERRPKHLDVLGVITRRRIDRVPENFLFLRLARIGESFENALRLLLRHFPRIAIANQIGGLENGVRVWRPGRSTRACQP